MTYLRPEEEINKTKRTERPFRLPTIDKSMASIERLKEKYKPVCKQIQKGEQGTSKPTVEDATHHDNSGTMSSLTYWKEQKKSYHSCERSTTRLTSSTLIKSTHIAYCDAQRL